jgi:hypothetical protein
VAEKKIGGEGNRRSVQGTEAVHPREMAISKHLMNPCGFAGQDTQPTTTRDQISRTKQTWSHGGSEGAPHTDSESAHLFRRRYRLLVQLLRAIHMRTAARLGATAHVADGDVDDAGMAEVI